MYKKHPTTAKKDYHTFSGVRTGSTPMHHHLAQLGKALLVSQREEKLREERGRSFKGFVTR